MIKLIDEKILLAIQSRFAKKIKSIYNPDNSIIWITFNDNKVSSFNLKYLGK